MNTELPVLGDMAVDGAGERGVVLTSSTSMRVYDLVAGERVANHKAAGPWLSLSPSGRWVATSDGVVRDVLSGEVVGRAPHGGLPRFVDDERLLVLTRGRATLWGWRSGLALADIDDDRLDPTASARVALGPDGLVAVSDPAGERLALLSLDEVRAVPLEGDEEPVVAAAFAAGALAAVQGGGLVRYALDGRVSDARRPHGSQTLNVAAREGEVATVGIALDGAFTLCVGDREIALPGQPPPDPALLATAEGWLVELWAGVALVGAEGIRRQLRLPLGFEKARPLRGGRCLAVGGENVLIATQPPLSPYVYRLNELTFSKRLEPDEDDLST